MRLYSSASVTRLFSSLVALGALLVFGFVAWKAFDVWRSDPAVRDMQQILHQQR